MYLKDASRRVNSVCLAPLPLALPNVSQGGTQLLCGADGPLLPGIYQPGGKSSRVPLLAVVPEDACQFHLHD